MPSVEVWSDITEHFDFVQERLIYVDAPLEGLLRAKTGELFAFRCEAIVAHALWHWIVVPTGSLETEVSEAFTAAHKSPTRWLSIVEDRRGEQPCIRAAWMDASQPIPPSSVW